MQLLRPYISNTFSGLQVTALLVFLLPYWLLLLIHRLLLKLLTSEKILGLVLGLLFPTYTPIFLVISFKQELKIPSIARGFQIICPD